MKLYLIITLLVVLLIILFYNVYYENFEDLPKPITQNSPVRVDFSCPDGDQKNIFDRFDYVQTASSNLCPSDYTKINNYFGLSNICLPNCPSGYTLSAVDNTLCVANICHNTADLSANILGSWYNTCSVIYKNQYNLTSTIASISTVTRNFNDQSRTINNEYTDLFMTLIILIFLLVCYLYYQLVFKFKEAFENLDLNGTIDISGIDINNVNISNALQTLQTMDASGSTAYARDVLTKTETQCQLFQEQKQAAENRIEEYRAKGHFDNLRLTYEMAENIQEQMSKLGC
jgi:hypothetical protein